MTIASRTPDLIPLLLVDDNDNFRQALVTALARRGHRVAASGSLAEALVMAERHSPERVILDLNLGDGDGLALIPKLLQTRPDLAIVVLTGYASIATAVAAIRLGAVHYLAKPAGVDEILAAFERTTGDAATPLPDTPMSLNQLEWEHLQRTLHEQDGNISAAARALGMHRRSLQRKLRKHARW
jgi:two-component system response regulator RegA